MGSAKRKRLKDHKYHGANTEKKKMEKNQSMPEDYRSLEKSTWMMTRAMEKARPKSIEEANLKAKEFMESHSYDIFTPENAEDEAQLMVYDAFSETGSQRKELALKALGIFPYCADAYVIMAEMEKNLAARKTLFEKGVEAGRICLGNDFFKENRGNFWGLIRTRPFMRAMDGFAVTLWSLGETEKAKLTYEEMLDLNPHDNQGIRFSLIVLYLETKSLTKAELLLKKYDYDYTAGWLYSKAILFYLKDGVTIESKNAIRKAFKENPHIPAMLLGIVSIPKASEYFSPGSVEEAANYVAASFDLWRKSESSLKWLMDEFKMHSYS
ncbi:MAG: hypothetical protein ACYCT2_09570 [Thermoplasmataceae archaeon]